MKTEIKRVSRGWFASRSFDPYMIETRIIGSRVELHATHGHSGHQFIAKADRLEDAAELLSDLIARTGAGSDFSGSAPPMTLKRALTRALHRLRRLRGLNVAGYLK